MSGSKNRTLHPRRGWLLMLGMGLLLAVGCSRDSQRHPVSGRVLFDGRPVPAGEIYFDPDVTKGNDGPQGFARISDGMYDTRLGGLAAASGPQVVRILGFDGKPGSELPMGRPLFSEYKTTAQIPEQGNATIDFDVSGRGKGR